MKWKINHVAILLSASTLAMIGLVIFQYKWIDHSRKLSDEIFMQRASMALCSTLEEYGGGSICNVMSCDKIASLIPGSENFDDLTSPQSSLVHNEDFQSDLRKPLDFYNINLDYSVSQSIADPKNQNTKNQACCVVNIPTQSNQKEAFIKLDFPDKEKFLMGNLKFMIGSSVLILLFTAIVLLLANWWLLKQKKLLQTNVDIYNNMAHEFRTPLTNISLASNFLAKDISSPKSEKMLDIISRENSKLIEQVERVLHLAKLDNRKYDLNREQIHLKSLLTAVRHDLEIQIDERNATVNIESIPSDLEIYGDPQHLTNVFRNLMENALKYAGERPQISISTKEQKEGILISFEDNGIGIPSSQHEHIFEKFRRVQTGNLHAEKGFGLGLTYVKKIIEMHKGFIHVDSEVNKGSCFTIYLPNMS
ncbi:MAG: HAMP domain-containing sensor histidine kinase [Saprospiraceae bacterium]